MNKLLIWTLSVPMTHPTRTMHTILTAMASGSGYVEVNDQTLQKMTGVASGSSRPTSPTSLYRMRVELVNLGMVQIENVYDATLGEGSPKVLTRRYWLATAPQEVSR